VSHPFYDGVKDFTFYIPDQNTELKRVFVETSTDFRGKLRKQCQVDEEATLCRDPNKHKYWPSLVNATGRKKPAGRLNVSSCFAGRFFSCTFRTARSPSGGVKKYPIKWGGDGAGYAPESKPPGKFLNTIDRICAELYKYTLEATEATGLIVISGATNSCKSNIARGLIHMYLKRRVKELAGKKGARRPHLVTFEDPVETYWARDPVIAGEAANGSHSGIDYTPREKGKDVASLKYAIEAALRQTPSVFFVGETRDPEDWKHLLRFAASGHLCVTTTHAVSLTETMGQILRAVGANSPSRRSDVARRVLAVIHLRGEEILCCESTPRGEKGCRRAGAPHRRSALIPAIWVKSDTSKMTLMSDGLTSLLPFRNPTNLTDTGCLGRTAFAEILLKSATKLCGPLESAIKNKARKWDLEGV
jgi:hypothetical protein